MTSKTSLFNKSIFRNNLRRLWWGSLLYFIILILVLPMQLSISGVSYCEDIVFPDSPSVFHSVLFRNSFALFTIALLVFVPVLVAMLLFRYLHVRKQAAAIHSLPVTRLSLFVTNFVSGIVLMYVPILLNGIILLCYSTFGGYCSVMPLESVFAFVGLQLLFSAVLFAVPVFFAMLTGNTILQVIFTYASYYLLLGLYAGISYLMSLVLFGYRDNNALLDWLNDMNPISLMVVAFQGEYGIDVWHIVFLLVFTALLLTITYLFYRRRNLETAGDAISFQWLKPIFKYLVTTCFCVLVVTYASALCNEISMLSGVLFVVTAFIAYFGSEMLIRKSFHVFHCWRGFFVFIAVVAVAVVGVKADLFGYEQRIPNLENVVSAAYGSDSMSSFNPNVARNTENEGVEGEVTSPEGIRQIAEVHRSIVAHKQEILDAVRSDMETDRYYRTVSYRMKDGKVITRYYYLDESVIKEALIPLYENQEYKRAYFDVARRFRNADFTSAEVHGIYMYSMDSDTAKEVYQRILSDIDTLGYEDVQPVELNVLCTVSFSKMDDQKPELVRQSASIHITPNFKNTLAYLEERNIYQRVALSPEKVEKLIVNQGNQKIGEMTDKTEIARFLEDYRKGKFSGEGNYEVVALTQEGQLFSLGVIGTSPYEMGIRTE